MILVLGGTAEARELAMLLDAAGTRFMSSLAGRVARPRLPVGAVHIGGFVGVPGLRSFLLENRVSAVVDATHPFAQGMTANAVAACTTDGVPLIRLERPGWSDAPGADSWEWVDDTKRQPPLPRVWAGTRSSPSAASRWADSSDRWPRTGPWCGPSTSRPSHCRSRGRCS